MIYTPNRFSIIQTSPYPVSRFDVAHSVLPTLPNIVGDFFNPDPYEMGNWIAGHLYDPPALVVLCALSREWDVSASLSGSGTSYTFSDSIDSGGEWRRSIRGVGLAASGGSSDAGDPRISFFFDLGGGSGFFDPTSMQWFPTIDISVSGDETASGGGPAKRTSYFCRAIEQGSISGSWSSDITLTVGPHTIQMFASTPSGFDPFPLSGSITITPTLPLIEV
jgi:hypothetical protein